MLAAQPFTLPLAQVSSSSVFISHFLPTAIATHPPAHRFCPLPLLPDVIAACVGVVSAV